jgi:hypothetical protein
MHGKSCLEAANRPPSMIDFCIWHGCCALVGTRLWPHSTLSQSIILRLNAAASDEARKNQSDVLKNQDLSKIA